MAREVIDNYPEYLKEFQEIKMFARFHENKLYQLKSAMKRMLKRLKVNDWNVDNWKEVVNWEKYASITDDEYIQRFFKKHTVTTKDVVRGLIETVTGEDEFLLDFDSENLLFTVRSTEEFKKSYKKKIREVVPANMLLEFEVVEEL